MRLPLRFTLPCVVALFATLASGQSLEFERSRHRNMLRMIKDDVKKNYYDPSFKGIDRSELHGSRRKNGEGSVDRTDEA